MRQVFNGAALPCYRGWAMEIKILSPEEIEFREKDIQTAFEQDLSKLEEGLVFVDSEVSIPVGRIDTLAFDTNTNQPVFVEFKGNGQFGKDALVQLMDYLSWFIRDTSRFAVLEKLIRAKRPQIGGFEPDIKLICVVSNIEERIRNAIYALANDAAIYSYTVATDTAGKIVVIPKLEIDNTDVERGPRIPVNKDDLLKKFFHLQKLYESLSAELQKNDGREYMAGRTFRYRKHRVFAFIRLRNNYLRLGLRVGAGKVRDSDFKYRRQGASDWGSVTLTPGKGIPEKIKPWIDIAREFKGAKLDDDDESGEEAD